MTDNNSTSLEQNERKLKELTMKRFNMSEEDWAKEKEALRQRIGEVSDSELSEALELGLA